MRFFVLSLCLFSFNLCCVSSNISNMLVYDPILEPSKSVVKLTSKHVESGQMIATGFAVDHYSIVTAAHYCTAISFGKITGEFPFDIEAFVSVKDGRLLKVGDFKVKYFDNGQDLCLIYSDEPHGLKPVFITKNLTEVRDEVVVIGAPTGFFPVETSGRVIEPKSNIDDEFLRGRLLIGASIYKGNSGGPVFNLDGEVVGVVIAGHQLVQHLAIATTSEELLKFLGIALEDGKQ